MPSLLIVAFLAAFIATAYIYVKYLLSYWKRRGVSFVKPSFPFGNVGPAFVKEKTFGQTLHEFYFRSNEPVLGIYTSVRPALLIRDPKIIRDILIKDFQSFWHRGFHYDENIDPLASNLFLQSGEKWRDMRNKLSPAFSSGKMKAIFDAVIECGKPLEARLTKLAATGNEIEVCDIFARFTTNVIASVAFGINVDCIENPDDAFRTYGGRFFEPKLKHMIRFIMSFLSPFLTKLFGIRFGDKDVGEFMKETIRQNLEYRENNNVVRKDFFQLLMQLRNVGKVQDDDSDWSAKSTNQAKSLSLDDMAAQAYVFFIAGYETSSSVMTFCMFELAKNQTIQQKVYEEITNVLDKHDGKITYDSLNDMKYLDKCIDETLRLNPPFEFFSRQCTQDYKIANSKVVIEKGTPVFFSITGPQYDPKYYDQPETFNPDRFKDELINRNSVGTPFLAFGDGPRNCIGMRLGKMQGKIGVCLLLRNFAFTLGSQHINQKLKLNPACIVRAPIDGIHLKVKAR